MTLQPPAPAPAGVPPLHGEPLPLEFSNTVFPVRGELRDGIGTPERLGWWLSANGGRLKTDLPAPALRALTPGDVAYFVLLRDALRRLVGAHVRGHAPDAWDVAQLNRASSLDRSWPLLCWAGEEPPTRVEMCTTTPLAAVQAEIAHAAIALLSGTSPAEPRACRAPGCVFFFDHARSRREWCSTGCGNRARVARHHARRRAAG
ncbi:CGNR zinc finger domain-containing protein [Streptomyces zingiberis]|uniref:CGNR zinc finger domain-containing protein n=1 Tax=Streptomyces zingiberis TaxID=2053010 RepID=A0ABX1BYS0_9ACTN|nr:CGNR zinc finger domain-containing protein [Streptomyces zingiberis]NJQ01625.1 CGNR zinc finger domain-containing protein [Streptomyces zingiberis]